MSWERTKRAWDADRAFQEEYDRDYPYEAVATEIARLRAANDLTQAELAGRIGTTQSAISRAESGRQPVSGALLSKIAAAFGLRWRPVFEPRFAPQAAEPAYSFMTNSVVASTYIGAIQHIDITYLQAVGPIYGTVPSLFEPNDVLSIQASDLSTIYNVVEVVGPEILGQPVYSTDPPNSVFAAMVARHVLANAS